MMTRKRPPTGEELYAMFTGLDEAGKRQVIDLLVKAFPAEVLEMKDDIERREAMKAGIRRRSIEKLRKQLRKGDPTDE